MQVNRYWDHIAAFAQKSNIHLQDIAVRINCNTFPFEIHVLDFHEFLDDSKNLPSHALIANELLRHPERKPREHIMVVLHFAKTHNTEVQVPVIVYLDDTWTKAIPNAPGGMDDEGATYVDSYGNAMVRKNIDALRVAVRLARKYCAELNEPVWSEEVVDKE